MVLLCSATVFENCCSNAVIVSSVFLNLCPLDAAKLQKTTVFSKKNQPILAILKNATVILFANYC